MATVLFTDIEGFSTISENLIPQELAQTLNDYFGATSTVIDRYGGVITQFEGDAMLITYNAVTPDEDHALNAVRTAIGIQEAVNGRTFGKGATLKTRSGYQHGRYHDRRHRRKGPVDFHGPRRQRQHRRLAGTTEQGIWYLHPCR